MTAQESRAGPLAGKRISFTGKLASMSRQQAEALVHAQGGDVDEEPTAETSYLVIGQAGWPLQSDGRLTRKLRRARELETERVVARRAPHGDGRDREVEPARGRAGEAAGLRVITEDDFLREVGASSPSHNVRKTFTLEQLARILEVPRQRLRRWVRAGLVQPVRTVHRLAYFDFAQVANAKALCELRDAGVSTARLRRSLERLRAWLPDAAESLAKLPLVSDGGMLLVRLDDGSLAEPGGQLVFDFDGSATDTSAAEQSAGDGSETSPPTSLAAWFELALEHEDAERHEDAVKAYQEALLLAGPHAELCFNLAGALFAAARPEQAVERYRQAVEIDPRYVEAWNNLGNALATLSEHAAAIECFEKAIAVQPDYPDAHYNLGATLLEMGDRAGARRHWTVYLELDPASAWADQVRARLARS